AVEMLMPGIERDGEHSAGLPLERDAIAGVVPHCRRAAAVECQDHLLVELALGRERSARGNFAHIAVVRGARGFVVDERPAGAAPRAGLQLDGAQVRDIMRADDVEALIAHPAQIGRVLFSGEFVRQFLRDDGVLGHAMLPATRLPRPHPDQIPSRPRSGTAIHFSARMRTYTLSPTGVLSEGCTRASRTKSPILTWKSRQSPRKALASTAPA